MGEGDAEVEAPAFMPGEDVHVLYCSKSGAKVADGCRFMLSQQRADRFIPGVYH